jgi:hypothetical protein
MNQLLFCCIAVFQYDSIIYQGGALANSFAMRRVAQLTFSNSLALINGRLFHMSICGSLPIANTIRVMVGVTRSMDAATARDHLSWCRQRLWLQLPLSLSLILFGSSCSQWICNDRAGFWIRDGGRQVFKTAGRSGSARNAGCGAGYNATR